MEDDLAVAALLQDMNDPVIKDAEEYKEPEEYVPTAQEQIDEISYMKMLGDEEPPLQIAESPPDANNDETCAALKSISDELNDTMSSTQIREKCETDEEMTKAIDNNNEIKTETIEHSIIEDIKKEPNEWQSMPVMNTSASSTAVSNDE